jgi:glycosyltransferase involved in cell wall biosynthesis
MRITYLSPSGRAGGAENAILDLIRAVREAEPSWRLSLVVPEDGNVLDRASALGVTPTVLPLPPALAAFGAYGLQNGRNGGGVPRLGSITACHAGAAYVLALRRTLRRLAPDVVHTNGVKAHLFASLARPREAALVWHLHEYLGRRDLTRRALRLAARRCAAVIANSRSVAADARAACRGLPDIHPVHNAVDLERFSPAGPRLDLDARSGLEPAPEGLVRVGLVGTLARWKGHELFLQALARLPAYAAVRGYVVGDGVYRTRGSQHSLEELRATAAALGLSGRVGFTGYVEDVPSALRALDVVVHASTEPEPFGLAIAEAMACGRPAVVSRLGGAAEFTEPDRDVLEFRPGDPAALAQAVLALAVDPVRRARLGRAARSSAELRLNRTRLAEQVLPVYRRLRSA